MAALSARAVLLAAVLGLVLAGGASAASFRTPSGNIGCFFTPASGSSAIALRCDLLEVAHAPRRPKSCQGDWGHAFQLTGTGRARRLCASDTVLDTEARVLPYGRTRHFGPFTCTSRRSGLRCVSRSGHGFALSRARQRLF